MRNSDEMTIDQIHLTLKMEFLRCKISLSEAYKNLNTANDYYAAIYVCFAPYILTI